MASSALTIKVNLDITEMVEKFELVQRTMIAIADAVMVIADACAEAIEAAKDLQVEDFAEHLNSLTDEELRKHA